MRYIAKAVGSRNNNLSREKKSDNNLKINTNYGSIEDYLRVVFIDLGIGTSVFTFIPVSPLLDHK